ncbi:hypothetical protein Aperf_G00000069909 [Anoplocephala perfoliata]
MSTDHCAILFREANKNLDSSLPFNVESITNVNDAYRIFLKHHTCYDIIPVSAKLIVFDVSLNVKKGFFALVYNGVRVAILWDPETQTHVGLLTITDFIRILHKYYKSPEIPIVELEEHQIKTWREQTSDCSRPLVYITPEQTLLEAAEMFLEHKVHRLPIMDPQTGNPIHILTHKRILKYLYFNPLATHSSNIGASAGSTGATSSYETNPNAGATIKAEPFMFLQNSRSILKFDIVIKQMTKLPIPDFMAEQLQNLPIGTMQNVVCVGTDWPLHRVLAVFIENRVSALPVIDENGCLVDIYAKFDVINLAATRSYDNLEVTVFDALQYRREKFSGVATCMLHNTLMDIISNVVNAGVHRLVVIDDCRHVLGIVSLSDILRFLIQKHPESD